MTRSEIASWLHTEFGVVGLATPDTTIDQIVQNAVRYWNTHSAYRHVVMYDLSSNVRLQLDKEFKSVVQVLPSTTPDWILQNHPLWTLLGIAVIDNLTSDMIAMSEAYRNYKYYIGMDFKWNFEMSQDPSVGGYLYLTNIPNNTTRFCVIGTRRIYIDEDITQEHILEWILEYSKALLMVIEGNTIRKSSAIGITNDGDKLSDEGNEKIKELQSRLNFEGRWLALCKRY